MNVAPNETPNQEKVSQDKEMNFRALEARYQRQLEQERAGRLEAERIARELSDNKSKANDSDDDVEDAPYVDHKRLSKTMNKFGQNTQSEIQKAMEIAKDRAKEELKQEFWLESNPDFHEVLEKHAEQFAQRAPKLADTILRMPNNFERQKLVYQNIKEFGLDKPAAKESTIQEKVDANRRSPFYQPSGVANAPYATQGDFSKSGKENAFKKMQELNKRFSGR